MHIHLSKPSIASSVSLLATLATVALIGCAEWDMQTRAEAASHFAASGDYARALISVLPFPWAMPIAGLVAVAGHISATVIRRGQKPQTVANKEVAEE